MRDGRGKTASLGRWTKKIKRSHQSFMSFCIVFLCLLVSSAWCLETAGEEGSWEDYSIITQRNIFSSTRKARSAAPSAAVNKTPAAVRTEQSYLVLRGVVRERDVFISFIEDSRTGEVKKVREGEMVGDGTLSGITMDYISFNLAEADTRVEIGNTLEGKTPEISSASYSGGSYFSQQGNSAPQQTMQPAEQAVVSEDEAKDILQRLKERRKKELGE